MIVIETERLSLYHLSLDDSEFILELLNEPSFIRFVGDKGVRTVEHAREYLTNGPIRSYAQNGYGLYLTRLGNGGARIGICGLVKRDELPAPDIGFAFLPAYWSQGFAVESATAVLQYGMNHLGLARIVAIVSPDNHSSISLLRKIGLSFERMVRLSDDADEIGLYGTDP